MHRARPTRWSLIWPYLAIALASIATIGTLLLVTQRYGGNNAPAVVVAESPVQAAPTPEEGATDYVDVSDDVLQGANLNAHVIVVNDRAPNGEAGRGQAALAAQGFTTVETETAAAPTETEATTILFRPGYEATGRAIAAVLHVPLHHMMEQELDIGDVLVVVRAPLELG